MTADVLWRGHEATPRQCDLCFCPKRHHRLTQADVLLAMLRKARANGGAVELPAIMGAGIAQHGARIAELRERGFLIRNEMERSPDGIVLSRYWLTFDPEQEERRP